METLYKIIDVGLTGLMVGIVTYFITKFILYVRDRFRRLAELEIAHATLVNHLNHLTQDHTSLVLAHNTVVEALRDLAAESGVGAGVTEDDGETSDLQVPANPPSIAFAPKTSRKRKLTYRRMKTN